MTTKTKTAKYISRFASLSIAIKSAHYHTVDSKRELVQGQRIQFEGGYYETDDNGIMEALELRADFGSAFIRVADNKTVAQMQTAMHTNDEQKKIIEEQQKEIDRLNGLKVEGEGFDKLKRPQLEEEAVKLGMTEEEAKAVANRKDLIALMEKKKEDASFDV